MVELRLEQGLFRLQAGDGGELQRVRWQEDDQTTFLRWARQYEQAAQRDDDPALLSIGREIGAWLDARGLQTLREGNPDIRFATPSKPDAAELAFLDVPWELLVNRDGGFWAQDAVTPYHPARLLGAAGSPAVPPHQDVQMLFMAAAPLGETELNYEAEEARILDATNGLSVRLVVEESGALEPLSQRVASELSWEVLHLSCHGNVHDKLGPVLALEGAYGDLDLVNTTQLLDGLGDVRPLLVCLSACGTAEHTEASTPLALELVRGRVPNVLGWDGSVSDHDAIAFSHILYGDLAKRRSVPSAVARARRVLLTTPRDEGGHHWHLARLYVGPAGGGPLSRPGGKMRPRPSTSAHQVMLDKRRNQVPVASPEVFVGRRRETQQVLREFSSRPALAGVVIHGMGRLGKSSLAARVGSRLPQYAMAVVFGQRPEEYDAVSIFKAVVEALSPEERAGVWDRWAPAIKDDPRQLRDALEAVLTGPAAAHDPEARRAPILLVIDDLERILEKPAPGQPRTPVMQALRPVLRDVIKAFDSVRGITDSRLLLTSRYLFTLPGDSGEDVAERLFALQLPPMNERQRVKLLQAEARMARAPAAALDAGQAQRIEALLERASAASAGNPGLLSLLSRPMRNPATMAEAESAIAAVERYAAEGLAPTGGDLGEFFMQLALKTYQRALTQGETAQMRAALVFKTIPVPLVAMKAAGRVMGVKAPKLAIERLIGLGCLDTVHLQGKAARDALPDLAVNALAAPLYEALTTAEQHHLAAQVLEPLYRAWIGKHGNVPHDERAVLLFELALGAERADDVVNACATAAAAFRWKVCGDAVGALDIVTRGLGLLDRNNVMPDLHLVRFGAEAAQRIGAKDQETALLALAGEKPVGQERAWAMLRSVDADRYLRFGKWSKALRIWRKEALPVFRLLKDMRAIAVTMGKIADVLQSRRKRDMALRIRREVELPAYQELADKRGLMVTIGKIADLLQPGGEHDKAVRLQREVELQVFEELGDLREWATTKGQIAAVHQARNEFDEALRIHIEERLPIARRLQDKSLLAHIRHQCAMVRIQKGVDSPQTLQTVFEELTEAFKLSQDVGRAEAIATIGRQLGSLLLEVNEASAAIAVLEPAAAAANTLGRIKILEDIKSLLVRAHAALGNSTHGHTRRPDE